MNQTRLQPRAVGTQFVDFIVFILLVVIARRRGAGLYAAAAAGTAAATAEPPAATGGTTFPSAISPCLSIDQLPFKPGGCMCPSLERR